MEDIKPKKRQQQKDSRKRKSTPKEDDSEVSSKKSKRGITRAEVLKFKVGIFIKIIIKLITKKKF